MPQSLTPEIITAAIAGFDQQKRRIDEQIAELRSMLAGADNQAASWEAGLSQRSRFTAAARRNMAKAQRARWARVRGEAAAASAESPKPKRKISPEGLKRIIAAQKKRWAQKRGGDEGAAKKAVSAKRKDTTKKASKAPQ